jgi:hypothetical protein
MLTTRDQVATILTQMSGENVPVTLDSASEVSLISYTAFEKLRSKAKGIDETGYMGHIPISQIKISGVNGKIVKNVNKQCSVHFKIDNVIFKTILVVMPHLTVDFLLGMDFFNKAQAILNFELQECTLQGDEGNVTTPFIKNVYPWTLIKQSCSTNIMDNPGTTRNKRGDKQRKTEEEEEEEFTEKFNKDLKHWLTNPVKNVIHQTETRLPTEEEKKKVRKKVRKRTEQDNVGELGEDFGLHIFDVEEGKEEKKQEEEQPVEERRGMESKDSWSRKDLASGL